MQHYLSTNNLSPLTAKQLHEINEWIIDKRESNEEEVIVIIQVSVQHTFWHQIFGDMTANEIINVMLSRLVLSFEILGGIDIILQHYLSSNNLSPLTTPH